MLRWVLSSVLLVALTIGCGGSDPETPGGGGAGGSGGAGGAGGTGAVGGSGGTGGGGGAEARCGDGKVEGDELCDDGEENSDNRPDACRTTCEPAHCGDGVVDSNEACDDGNTTPGDGCDASCALEERCGDGIRNGDEACDGTDIPATCVELGFAGGELACTSTCALDESGCWRTEDCATPGDEDGDGAADCDDADCTGHFECPVCGDGIVQRDEACDGAVPAGLTCFDRGFDGGDLACTGCAIDESGCFRVERCDVPGDEDGDGDADCDDSDCVGHFECPVCGDGIIQRGEICDGAVPAGLSCANYGANSGQLACTDCRLDSSGCFNAELCDVAGDEDGDGDADCDDADCETFPPCVSGCGNGTLDPGESCDDGNVAPGDGCSDACQIEGMMLADQVGGFIQLFGSLQFPDPQLANRIDTWCLPATFGPQYYDLAYFTNYGPGALHVQVEATWTGSDLTVAVTEAPFDPQAPTNGCIDFDGDNDNDDVVQIRWLIVPPGGTVALVPTAYFVNQVVSSYTVIVTTMGVCGDGTVTFPERCDDGNVADGDACPADCGIAPLVQDVEPNDTTSAATPLPPGAIGVGTLAATQFAMPAVDPVDHWQVDLAAGTTYAFRTRDDRQGNCGFFNLQGDTKLELLDAAGNVLATGTNQPSGTEFCADVTWTATSSGPHYLRVTQENTLGLPDPLPTRYFLFAEPL